MRIKIDQELGSQGVYYDVTINNLVVGRLARDEAMWTIACALTGTEIPYPENQRPLSLPHVMPAITPTEV